MSKSSPITNRIQKALYMKSSALKQDAQDDQESKAMKSIVKDESSGSVKDATTTTETVQLPDVVTGINENIKGSYSGDTYKGDYYAPDSPLGKEMAKLGLDPSTPDSIKDYEQSKLIENKQRRLSGEIKDDGKFGDITGTDDEGNTRTLSDEETLGLTAEQIGDRKSQSQTTTPGGTEEITKTVTEEKPQDFQVHSQLSAGQAARGNQKAINKAMRTERSLGAFEGAKPEGMGFSSGDKWTKKDKRLYAAKLASGADLGYGTGIGIGGQSYEKNKMVYQKNAGEKETNTYTNFDDPKHNPKNITIKDAKSSNAGGGEKVASVGELTAKGVQELETKPIEADLSALVPREKVSAAAKMLGTSPLNMGPSPFKKGKQKAVKLFGEYFSLGKSTGKSGKVKNVKLPDAKTKNVETIDNYTIKNKDGSNLKVENGKVKGYADGDMLPAIRDKNLPAVKAGDDILKTGPKTKGGKNLKQDPSVWDKTKSALGKLKPGKKTAIAGALGVTHLGAYLLGNRGSDESTNTEEGGGGGGGGTEDTKVTPPVVTPPVIKKTNKTDNMGLGEIDGGTKVAVGRGSKPNKDISATVGTSLSETMSRTQQRQADKELRRAGRQARKDANLAARQKRRDSRRKNPTIVGQGLRNAAGKVFDSSVNNMGNQTATTQGSVDLKGYSQKNKKKKGQFGSTSRPGYNA